MEHQNLPKIELHLHLDCCLSYEVVQEIDPSITYEEYRKSFVAPPKCNDLADFLTRAVKGFELMQTEEQLRLVTFDLFKQLKEDNVIYAEIRFAPLLHIQKGLSEENVVKCINSAVEDCIEHFQIEAGIILCTLRHFDEEQSMKTVSLVKEFLGTRVVGFDIAANEAGYPITNHLKAFEFAHRNNINCTAHAGEARGSESIWETLKHFRPSRIGHGVRSIEDGELLEFLLLKGIHLEVCPTSNVQVNVYEKIEDHPADTLYNLGISMSLNTDTRTISDTTLTSEYVLMHDIFNWKKEHFKKCNLEAIKYSFAKNRLKKKLQMQIENAY